MKSFSKLAFILGVWLLPGFVSASGGYTAWYQSQFGGGKSFNHSISNGYVGGNAYHHNINFNSGYSVNNSQNLGNVGIGGYNTFSGNNGYGNSRGGGMTGFYAANGMYQNNGYRHNTGGFTGSNSTNNTNNSTRGGYTGYFAQNLQANTFARQCTPAPRPTANTCQGGSIQPIINGYGCTIEWRCDGGNFCPQVNQPATECSGVWEPQYNSRTQCLTHYFCDRRPDTRPCPEYYEPVCGLLNGNFITYSNSCFLSNARATFQYNGQCRHNPINSQPVISSFNGPSTLMVGETGNWTVVARSQPNDQLSYTVDWGENVNAVNQASARRVSQKSTFTHQYSRTGTYTVRVTVANQQGQTATSTKTVQVSGGNFGVPNITSFTGPSTLNVGEIGHWRVTASEPANHPIEFSINWGQRALFNPENRASSVWSTSRTFQQVYNQSGVYQVTVTATSARGSTSKSLTLRVQNQPTINTLPVVHGISGPTSLRVGQNGTWRIQASDSSNQNLSYQIDWGDKFHNNQARSISTNSEFVQNSTFTHQYLQPGNYTVRVTVKNQQGQTARASITVRVNEDGISRPYYNWY